MLSRTLVPTVFLTGLCLQSSIVVAQGPVVWRQVSAPALLDLQFEPTSPTWIDEQRLVLIDGGEHQLVVVNVSSGATTRLGRSGQGPGEFTGTMVPARLAGGIGVWDIPTRRLTRFDKALTLVGTATFTTGFMSIASVGDSLMVGIGGLGGRPTVYKLDPSSGRADTLFAIGAVDSALLARPMQGMPGPPPLITVIGGAHLTLISQWSYALTGADTRGTALFRGGRRDLPPQVPSASVVTARRTRMEQSMAQMDPATRKQMAPMFERTLSMPEPFVTLGGLGADAGGCLYAVTSRLRVDSTEIDIFTSEGRLARTLAVPGKVSGVSSGGSVIAFVSEQIGGENAGVPNVLLYRPLKAGAPCH